jgi:peptide deformylase
VLSIVNHPHPALSTAAEAVSVFDKALCALVDEMTQTMYASGGVGLAAPQVNVSQRVLLIDPSGGEEPNQLMVMINPSVIWASKEMVQAAEGCLSLPGVILQVLRHLAIEVEYLDVTGNSLQHMKLVGMSARIVQHEIDHLDGVTMLSKVGHAQRTFALKELGKNR